MKKTLILSLSLIFAVALLIFITPSTEPEPAFAWDEGIFVVSLIDQKELTITGLVDNSYSGELEIPDTLRGWPVTRIRYTAFQWCTGITSVTIPASITEIGHYAFYGCTNITMITVDSKNKNYSSDSRGVLFDKDKENLIQYPAANKSTNYTIPYGVKNIGAYAFDNCTSLTEVYLQYSTSTGIETIGNQAFNNCTSLKKISLPATCTAVGLNPFAGCTSLREITVQESNKNFSASDGVLFNLDKTMLILYPIGKTDTSYQIPSTVTSLYDFAFYGSTLQSIGIPSSVKTLHFRVFNSCHKLQSITIPASITSIGEGMFSGCSSLTAVNLPSSVTNLGASIFTLCSSLKNFVIPAGVTTVDAGVFNNCELENITFADGSKLTDLNILNNVSTLKTINNIPAGITSLPQDAFKNRTALTNVSFASGSKLATLGAAAFQGCTSLQRVIFDESCPLTTIPTSTFLNCKSLTNVNLPANVKTIAENVFDGCTSLTSLTLPKGLTTLNTAAFEGSSITSVTFADGCKLTDLSVFYSMSSLKNLHNIPAVITSLPNAAFKDHTTIESISFASGSKMTSIGTSLFSGCTSLKSISLPANLTTIGASGFYNCLSLDGITLPKSLTTFGNNAFYGCTALTSLTIPEGVTHLPLNGFRYCSGLKSISIPKSVTTIDKFAFSSCSSLTSITIPESITTLNPSTFNGCTSLATVNLSKNLTTIDNHAFTDCKSLTAINLPSTLTRIGINSFQNCTALASITIPANLLNIDSTAFTGCTNLKSLNFPDDSKLTDLSAFFTISALTEINNLPSGVTNLDLTACRTLKALETITVNAAHPTYSTNENGLLCNVDKSTLLFCPSAKQLTSYEIPASVITIGAGAFQSCSTLSTVTFAAGCKIETIGENAFNGSSLTNIEIPASVTTIGAGAFQACTKFAEKGVTFAEGSKIETIGTRVFSGSAMQTIELPKSVTTIGESAFNGSFLTTIKIPASVTTIGASAFRDCEYFTTGLTFAEESKLETIENRAFYSCINLFSIELPASVTSIGSEAFYYCFRMQQLTFGKGCELEDISDSLFSNCWALSTINNFPASVKSIGNNAFFRCEWLANITFSNQITFFGTRAFWNCHAIKSITIGEGTTSIPNEAFSSCFSLESIHIPESVTSIGNSAFNSCNALEDVTFGKNSKLLSIGPAAFSGGKFSKIEIPKGVTSIGTGAFNGCPALETVTFEKDSALESLGASAFYSCKKLLSIEIPEGITSIDEFVFGYCESLTSVKLPTNLKSIGKYAFLECHALQSIILPAGILSIGTRTFANTFALKFVHIPLATTTIASDSFARSSAYICASSEDCYAKTYADTYSFVFAVCESCADCSVHYELTSNNNGTHQQACSNCEKRFGDPLDCIEVVDAAVPATCIESGLAEGSHCAICAYVLRAQTQTAPLEHTYNYVANGEGKHTGTCTKCAVGTEGRVVVEDCTPAERDETVLPTCTTAGYTTHYCEHCNYSWQDSRQEASGHAYTYESNGEGKHTGTCTNCQEGTDGRTITEDCTSDEERKQTLAPTCTEDGYTKHFCEHCTYTWQSDTDSKTGHSYTYVYNNNDTHTATCSQCTSGTEGHTITKNCKPVVLPETFPTCTEKGLTEGSKCEDCGHIFIAQTEKEGGGYGHIYGEWVSNNNGSHTKTCTNGNCTELNEGHTITEDCTANTALDEIVATATCTEDGYTKHYCEHCTYTWQSTVSKTGHIYGEWASNNNGSHTKTCTNDNCTELNEGHTITEDCTANTALDQIVDAICNEDGYTKHYCEHCTYTWQSDTVTTSGHSYGNWVSNNNGSHTKTCTKCLDGTDGHTVTVDCTPDTDKDETLASTCTEGGYTTHFCEYCNYTWQDTPTEPLGHNYDYVSNEDGTHTGTCFQCQVSAAERTITEACTPTADDNETVLPTCNEEGYTSHICEVCESSYRDATVAADGHDYTYTSNGDGSHTGICPNCPDGADGHEFTADCTPDTDRDESFAATCTEDGYTKHFCEHCEYIWNEITNAATGHSHANWASNNNGSHTKTCTNDNCTELNEGHTVTENCSSDAAKKQVIAPTCTEDGYTKHYCEHCTYTWQSDTVLTSGHSYEYTFNNNGTHTDICTVCPNDTEGHTITVECHPVVDSAVKATCIATGLTEGSHCADCGHVLVTQEVVAMTEHSYGDWVLNEDGTRTKTCTMCNVSIEDSVVATSAFDSYRPVMWWLFGGAEVVWSGVMGVSVFLAKKKGQAINIKKLLIRYAIGFGIIAVALVGLPYLIKGIVSLF